MRTWQPHKPARQVGPWYSRARVKPKSIQAWALWRVARGLRSAIRSLRSVTPALDDGGIFQPDGYVRRIVEEASAAG